MGSMNIDDNRIISPTEGFLLSLDKEQLATVKLSYKEYNTRLGKWKSQYPYYLRKQNLKDLLGRFDFKLDPKYTKVLNKLSK